MLDGNDFKQQLSAADIVADSRRRVMTELLRLCSDPRFRNTPEQIDQYSKAFTSPMSVDPGTGRSILQGYKISADELEPLLRHAGKIAGFGQFDTKRDWGKVYEFTELPRSDRLLAIMRLSDTGMVAAAVWMCWHLDCPVPLHLVCYLGLPPYHDFCIWPCDSVTYLPYRRFRDKSYTFAWPAVIPNDTARRAVAPREVTI